MFVGTCRSSARRVRQFKKSDFMGKPNTKAVLMENERLVIWKHCDNQLNLQLEENNINMYTYLYKY